MDILQSDKYNEVAFKLQRGDRKAAEIIFDHFSPQIYRFFLIRTLSRETAEDLTQEVFLKVIDKIQTFNHELGSFSGWIWQIAKNSVKDYYRKKKPFAITDILLQNKEKTDFQEGKNNPLLEYKVAEILDLIKEFDEDDKEIFSLHYLSDLPYKKISRLTGKSESSLRVVIHRLNKKIRKIINNE